MGLLLFVVLVMILGCGGTATYMKSQGATMGEAIGAVMAAVITFVCTIMSLPFKICSMCRRGEGAKRDTNGSGFGSEDLHNGFSSFSDKPDDSEVGDIERGGRGRGR